MRAHSQATIIRVLTATVAETAAGPFHDLMRQKLPILRDQEGLVHVRLARRLMGHVEEIVLFQEWRDADAMYAWTGPDVDRPRLLQGHEELVEQLVITHYEDFELAR
jgi:heme-degrading monooxygenase HmoA